MISGFQISHAGTSPDDVINTLHQTLIELMQQSKDLDYGDRHEILKPVVIDSFDFEIIARIVMGRYWKKLDDQQQSTFIDVFSRLSIATYTAQFDSFSGQAFEYVDDEKMKKGRILVRTQLVTNDRVVSFNYVLHPVKDRWRIINVIADGVSDLSLKRSDYTAIMKSDGFDELVSQIREKIKSSSGKEL